MKSEEQFSVSEKFASLHFAKDAADAKSKSKPTGAIPTKGRRLLTLCTDISKVLTTTGVRSVPSFHSSETTIVQSLVFTA